MDVPFEYSLEGAYESGILLEDNKNKSNSGQQDTTITDEETNEASFTIELNDEGDDDDVDDEENMEVEENSDNNDFEKDDGEDLLLAIGAGGSEERTDSFTTSNEINPSMFNLPFLQKPQESIPDLPGGLEFLNLSTDFTNFVPSGSSQNTANNASTCLFLNKIYQQMLIENLSKIRAKLAENQEKQNLLVDKIRDYQKHENIIARKNVFCIPYFHHKQKENVPEPNAHTKILQTWHADKIVREKPWTNKDHDELEKAIHENAWKMSLKPFLNRLEIYSVKMLTLEDEGERQEYEQKIEECQREMDVVHQKDITEILCEIDDQKYDWMRISNLNFKGRHSAFSCEQMWKNWVNPRLNKTPWKVKETQDLQRLVDKHGRNSWQLIAKELGTNRTAFHCLQHYRRKLDKDVKREWGEEESKILKEVIEMCRVGDYIPWNQVSFYMEGRGADACVKRWRLLNPDTKKGRWTIKEDSLLLAAVNMIGTNNWSRIKRLIPGRSSSQCRERWANSLDPTIKAGPFTYDEDKLLLKYMKQYGKNWANIAYHLPGRTDCACRTQYRRHKKWRAQWEYISKQTEESQKFFIHDFNVKKYANLVESGKKTLEQLFPIQPYRRKIEETLANQPQMLKRDYVRQEIDRRNGEEVIPRPPILRKYSNHSLVKLWQDRNNLRKTIEDFISKKMVKEKNKTAQKKMKKTFHEVSPRLNNLKPSTTVSELLDMARSITAGEVTEKDKYAINKKRACAVVDKQIRSLLYIDWLKEDMKDQPKLIHNKSGASCEEEKFLDRLEGMRLCMTMLGMNRERFVDRVARDTRQGVPLQSTSYEGPEEMQKFREQFLHVSAEEQDNVSPSGRSDLQVSFPDTITPNIHTLTAFRLLFLDTQNLQQSADKYGAEEKKKKHYNSDDDSNVTTLPERLEKIKGSILYQMLRCHFRSAFMWPALLASLCPPKNLNALNASAKPLPASPKPLAKTNTKPKKRIYPMAKKQVKSRHANYLKKKKKQPKPIPMPEEKESPGISTSSSPSKSPPRRKRGRPAGSLTMHRKVWDDGPPRVSSRQIAKKSRIVPDESETSDDEAFLYEEKKCRRVWDVLQDRIVKFPKNKIVKPLSELSSEDSAKINEKPSSSNTISHVPETIEEEPEESKPKDLLANLTSDLVQQVISQEVQVKQVGTYVNVPLPVEKKPDMPTFD